MQQVIVSYNNQGLFTPYTVPGMVHLHNMVPVVCLPVETIVVVILR